VNSIKFEALIKNMRFTKLLLMGTALLVASPIFAAPTTYFGGFEDSVGSSSDYDYNDLVFSISGESLTLNSASGVWFKEASAGVLNTNAGGIGLVGTPFWNNSSLDGSGGRNLGFCIYGGGACGTGLAPTDSYLATSTGNSVNDVFFSVSGDVTEQVTLAITAANDSLGWQLVSGGAIHSFGTGAQGPVSFTPGGDFVLVGLVSGGPTFTSNHAADDGVSHFAFFGPAVPEPSSIGLLGFALLGGGLAFRKRFKA
jgi:hypothetical protein